MNALDFLIIGAQKCATTALFEQLRAHPSIEMPLEKEVPFFTREDAGPDTWEAFSSEHFGEPDGRMRGKATPQYLADPGAARRIAALAPDARLVVILRDPLERTWSHYRMDCRRGTESRAFPDVLQELVTTEGIERGRSAAVPSHAGGFESEAAFHVAWSEFGRCLEPYLERFSADQLLVLYQEDLARSPEETLDRLLVHLGLEPGFRPPALGKVVHAGGAGNRIPHGVRVWLRERGPIRGLWNAIPERRRGRLRFLYERWNGAGGGSTDRPDLPDALDRRLRAHFSTDLETLVRAGIAPPPWLDRYSRSADSQVANYG